MEALPRSFYSCVRDKSHDRPQATTENKAWDLALWQEGPYSGRGHFIGTVPSR
jgi:hypothetical protein